MQLLLSSMSDSSESAATSVVERIENRIVKEIINTEIDNHLVLETIFENMLKELIQRPMKPQSTFESPRKDSIPSNHTYDRLELPTKHKSISISSTSTRKGSL